MTTKKKSSLRSSTIRGERRYAAAHGLFNVTWNTLLLSKFYTSLPDKRFVKNFTPLDFQAKNFTPAISPNFNSFSDKNTKK